MAKHCKYCYTKFFKKRNESKFQWEDRKFCSRDCGYKAQTGKPHPNNRRKMTTEEKLRRNQLINYSGQNNPFYGRKHSSGTRKYLSAVKQRISMSEWEGFKRSESYNERRVFRSAMQKLIFKRDNYMCQICESNKDLQVDHIQSWSEFKELRFDPENCRTLCAKCHYKITFNKEMPNNIKGWGHNLMKGRVAQ